MQVGALATETDFDGWRKAARRFRMAGIRPEEARFEVGGAGQGGLFDADPPVEGGREREFAVPRAFVDLAQNVIL
ncbi:MAG: uracil-DNA glycosylase, partial [Brevundimonas sp.]